MIGMLRWIRLGFLKVNLTNWIQSSYTTPLPISIIFKVQTHGLAALFKGPER